MLGSSLVAAVRGGDRSADRLRILLEAAYQPRGVLLTDSGTTALTLAIMAALEDRSGPIALPSYGCYDLATAIVGAGARAVFYDLEPETLQPAPDSLAAALSWQPAALVIAHLFGVPVDLRAATRESEVSCVVIDDAAQAVGATLRGRPAGTLGTFGVLSFGRGKGLGGAGGGALLAFTDDAARRLAALGRDLAPGGRGGARWVTLAAQWVLGRPPWYGVPAALPFLRLGETIYRAPHAPRAITAASAGAVVRAWGRSARDREVRRRQAERLDAAARQGSGIRRISISPDGVAGYLRYPMLAPDLAARSGAWRVLGVARGYPRPLPTVSALADRSVNGHAGFPGADTLATALVTLPTHRFVRARDHERLRAMLEAGASRAERGAGIAAHGAAVS
jgi:dTDP-4-amino-4,6-dideoxygalactose transaminase